jgi:hypothetical protein
MGKPLQPISFQTNEKWLSVQPGDTYESLSQRFYGTPALAAALQEYNRTYGQTAAQREGKLVPGEKVFIPERPTLERPLPRTTPPQWPGPQGANGSSSGAGGFLATAQYRVRGPGERLYAIAQKTLGTGDRWQDIARLNPTLRGEQDVPPNTLVQLPNGANVPEENRP